MASSSLQFRLTAGITTASVIGLGSVAIWTGWTMQQLLVVSHTKNVEAIARRFPYDVKLYSEMVSMETAVQKAIDNSASPNLLIWVKRPNGSVLAESPVLRTAHNNFTSMLMTLSEMPLEPQVYPINQQYLILSSSALSVEGKPLGQLYMAQDITDEQIMLNDLLRSVSIVTVLATILLTTVCAMHIRRSLRPLRKISQLAGTISADDLNQAHLYLDRAPDEVQELAHMLDGMLSRLSQSWEQQQQFVSNVSHELRTPLSVVYGYLQSVLRRSTTLSESHREALEISVAETERTIRLLQDLLDLARADNGGMRFNLEPLVLNDLVAEVAGMSRKVSDRLIQIEAEQPKICVRADRDRLTQVLINLIDNAVKYSDPPEPILLKLAQTKEGTTIQVSDRGCGIPLQNQARIFERFYRVNEDRSRASGGVGLGLSIVKSLVEGMGSRITVWSELGKGSTFTITLPPQQQTYEDTHSPG
ncbi:MAG TPA: ATP-binding protein [Coleofasciculaceae cyanobacterium]